MPVNRRWIEAAVPEKPASGGYPIPKTTDFKLVEDPVPTESDLADGQVLIKTHFLSPDPYVISLIMVKPEMVGKTVWAGASGEVLMSKHADIAVGDFVVVSGPDGGCQEYVQAQGDKVTKLPKGTPLSAALGVCGMPGVTAFLATRDILGADLSGQTVVVTGAAGAVGSAAAQVAKHFGAKVVGLAGTDEKCTHATNKFGIDHMLNYKSATLAEDLKKLAPFHAFYDNTGGPAAKLIKALLVDGAPLAKVGSIGGPSDTDHDTRIKIQGFYAGGLVDKWGAAIAEMAKLVGSGAVQYDETVVKGIESVPEAFIRQRTGKQLGKMIVDLRPSANNRWIEAAVPQKPAEGGYPIPKVSDFKMVQDPVPTEGNLADGQVLVKTHFLSPDPYIVSMIMVKPDMVGKTVWAGASGEVVLSKSDKLAVGDLVVGGGECGSQQYFTRDAEKLTKLPPATPLSAALGVCGMPGVTAYLATTTILGDDLSGKTIAVTGAAGAVGSAAAQIAKILGATVVGLAGSDEKCSHVKNDFGVDHMLNYKSASLAEDLKKLGPFHGFYDNTGGPAAILIKGLAVDGAPVAKVGSIGGPSDSEHDARLKISGFYAGGCIDQWPAAIGKLTEYVTTGKLKYDETVLKGIESVPEAFIRQRTGKQLGKMIVDLR